LMSLARVVLEILRSIVSDAQIIGGVGHFEPKFQGVPLGVAQRCWGCKERTSQAN